jgi:drug/metabolite transporter (DMT)-like permease
MDKQMPFVSQLYFKSAIAFLVVGIIIALHMSISGDHSAMGAHAHINLLGWVTSALFGGYLALNPAKAEGRLPIIQYAVYNIGLLIMLPALYMMLRGNPAMEPLVATGSLIVFAGVLLFAVMIFTRREPRPSSPRTALAG